MLNPELLALLVCPETQQDVILAVPEEIARINAAIGQGQVRNVAGASVDQPVEAALIRADRRVAYPIRDGIPVMLVAEGLDLTPVKFNANV
jgi:uncharacterized protein YbaR (Trm112 family)